MAGDGHKHSRAVSWVAVTIILAGFVLGGIALILGLWWLFWTALGVVVVGGIVAVAIDIFADVELDPLNPGEPLRRELTGGGTAEIEGATTEPTAAEPDVAPS
ncbi:MAG TPA: HGxxPAAW family protein [Streptosporangiales bacterium]